MGLYQSRMRFAGVAGLRRSHSHPDQTGHHRQGDGQAADGQPGPEETAGDQSVDQYHQKGEPIDSGDGGNLSQVDLIGQRVACQAPREPCQEVSPKVLRGNPEKGRQQEAGPGKPQRKPGEPPGEQAREQ